MPSVEPEGEPEPDDAPIIEIESKLPAELKPVSEPQEATLSSQHLPHVNQELRVATAYLHGGYSECDASAATTAAAWTT